MILLRKSEPIYCLAKMSPTASEMSDIFMNNRRLLYLLYWTAVVSNNTKLMQTKPILQCYCRPESNPFQQDSYPEAQLRNLKVYPNILDNHLYVQMFNCSSITFHNRTCHMCCSHPSPPLPPNAPIICSIVREHRSIALSSKNWFCRSRS